MSFGGFLLQPMVSWDLQDVLYKSVLELKAENFSGQFPFVGWVEHEKKYGNEPLGFFFNDFLIW